MTTAPEAPSVPGPDPGDRRRQRLLSYSTKNMVYSLVAVFALAFGVWALMPAEEAFERRSLEVDAVAAYAAEQVPYPVWAPAGLPEGWTVTTVRLGVVAGEQTWRVGVVTPADEYVVLSQALEPAEEWREAVLGQVGQLGEVELGAPPGPVRWQQWSGEDATALVLPPSEAQPATTVVVGSGTQAELAEFVAHLEVAS